MPTRKSPSKKKVASSVTNAALEGSAGKDASPLTQEEIANASAEVERAVISLLRKEPFYAHLLTSLKRLYGNEVQTAAVSATGAGVTLWVNPRFFCKEVNAAERIAVLKHEMLHLLFKHPWRDASKMPDADLRNIAADLVVNQFITPWKLPAGCIELSTVLGAGLEPDQTMEWYYNKLRQWAKSSGADWMDNQSLPSGHPHDGGEDSHNEETSGNEQDPKSPDEDASMKDGVARHRSQVREQLEKANARFKEQGCDDKWGEKAPDAQSHDGVSSGDYAEAVVRGLVSKAKAKLSDKEWGDMSLGVQRMIDVICAPPKLPWKRLLRLFAGRGSRTIIKTTRLKESNRFPGEPGIRIKRLQKLVVAVDTSGSIGEKELGEFLAEINGIARAGAEITLVECDSKIHTAVPYRRGIMPQFKGGGGTNFDPVMQWLRDNKGLAFGGCIYLTDGCAARPTIDPRCPVLWVITPHMDVKHGWSAAGMG